MFNPNNSNMYNIILRIIVTEKNFCHMGNQTGDLDSNPKHMCNITVPGRERKSYFYCTLYSKWNMRYYFPQK